MARSTYLPPDQREDYTDGPTHVRVYSVEMRPVDGYPARREWIVDGADDTGAVTEQMWTYTSGAEALADVPDFIDAMTEAEA